MLFVEVDGFWIIYVILLMLRFDKFWFGVYIKYLKCRLLVFGSLSWFGISVEGWIDWMVYLKVLRVKRDILLFYVCWVKVIVVL